MTLQEVSNKKKDWKSCKETIENSDRNTMDLLTDYHSIYKTLYTIQLTLNYIELMHQTRG